MPYNNRRTNGYNNNNNSSNRNSNHTHNISKKGGILNKIDETKIVKILTQLYLVGLIALNLCALTSLTGLAHYFGPEFVAEVKESVVVHNQVPIKVIIEAMMNYLFLITPFILLKIVKLRIKKISFNKIGRNQFFKKLSLPIASFLIALIIILINGDFMLKTSLHLAFVFFMFPLMLVLTITGIHKSFSFILDADSKRRLQMNRRNGYNNNGKKLYNNNNGGGQNRNNSNRSSTRTREDRSPVLNAGASENRMQTNERKSNYNNNKR